MAISTIRKVTDLDSSRLDAAFERFVARHKLSDQADCWQELNNFLEFYKNEPRYSGLLLAWKRVMCRALREHYSRNITIGYGYVGHYVD